MRAREPAEKRMVLLPIVLAVTVSAAVCLNGPVPHFPTPKLSSRLSRAVNRVLGKGRRYKQ